MKPRMVILRRAFVCNENRSERCAVFTLDGVEFYSDSPRHSGEEFEINSAIERLADFVNSVALSP
jgi:hypothetical protein